MKDSRSFWSVFLSWRTNGKMSWRLAWIGASVRRVCLNHFAAGCLQILFSRLWALVREHLWPDVYPRAEVHQPDKCKG
jgi:hypothetical protein